MLQAALRCARARSHAVGACRAAALRRGFASPGDFDLIADEQGTARVEGWDETGFVVSGVQYPGALLIYSNITLCWKPSALKDINIDMLAPLLLFRQRPDLLVLGCGKKLVRPPPELAKALAEHGIRLDCLDTANAVATFNILSQEGRRVAAALLPASQEPVAEVPAPEAPRSTTGPFPNWRDRERMV